MKEGPKVTLVIYMGELEKRMDKKKFAQMIRALKKLVRLLA